MASFASGQLVGGSFVNNAGGVLNLTGNATPVYAGETSLINAGLVETSGNTTLSAPITTPGTILATSGTLDLTGQTGLIQVNAGAVLDESSIITAPGNLNITGSIVGNGTISVTSGAGLEFGTTGAKTPRPYSGSIADVVNDGAFTIENGSSST